MIGEGLAALACALLVIFCTPVGWIGIMVAGFAISMIIETKKEKKSE